MHIMRFILGPLAVALGVAMMKYSFWITQQTGKIDFAEKYLASPLSGTYTWWKLVGLFFIVLALLWMGGILDFGQATTTVGV
jgi:hypothetical protein